MNRNGLLRLALLIAALFIGLTLAACSGSAPVAQVTPFPTATAQPTTATTDTPTPEPTESPSPAPSATPAATTDPAEPALSGDAAEARADNAVGRITHITPPSDGT